MHKNHAKMQFDLFSYEQTISSQRQHGVGIYKWIYFFIALSWCQLDRYFKQIMPLTVILVSAIVNHLLYSGDFDLMIDHV